MTAQYRSTTSTQYKTSTVPRAQYLPSSTAHQGMAEVVYDILMALLVCIFGIFALIYATNTESKGMDFVHRIARIPFASPGHVHP